MKEYHTAIIINSPPESVWKELTNFEHYPEWNPIVGKPVGEMIEGEQISTFIVPLHKTYYVTLLSYKESEELLWQGTRGAKFLMTGKHYYRLRELSDKRTELLHGEYFTGLFSYFISPALLAKMEAAFEQHNILLKQRIENGKK